MKSKNMLATNPVLEARQNEDFYATHPNALKSFLAKIKDDGIVLPKNIWECAVGMGHLANVLEEQGYCVKKTDIVNRGYKGTELQDFLTETEPYNGTILTNPPFKLAENFLQKAMELLTKNNFAIFFLKIQFLESKARKLLFEKFPPKFVYIHSERQHTAKDGDFEKYTLGTLCFCWFIWEKGNKDEPILRWI